MQLAVDVCRDVLGSRERDDGMDLDGKFFD